jgi:hypothetical protein
MVNGLGFYSFGNPAISLRPMLIETRGFACRSHDRVAFVGKPAQIPTKCEIEWLHRLNPCGVRC